MQSYLMIWNFAPTRMKSRRASVINYFPVGVKRLLCSLEEVRVRISPGLQVVLCSAIILLLPDTLFNFTAAPHFVIRSLNCGHA
jgi:hypothetical protein